MKLIDFGLDQEGVLHIIMPKEVWTALIALAAAGGGVPLGDNSLVKLSLTKVALTTNFTASASGLNPPCPPVGD